MTNFARLSLSCGAAFAIALQPTTASGQEPSLTDEEKKAFVDGLEKEAVVDKSSVQDVGGPLDEAGVSAPSNGEVFRKPTLQLQAEDGSATGVIATGFDRVRSRPTGTGSVVSRKRLDLKLTIPFEQVGGRNNFFDFKRIGGGESVNVGFSYLWTKASKAPDAVFMNLLDTARDNCVTKASAAWLNTNINSFESVEKATEFLNEYQNEYVRIKADTNVPRFPLGMEFWVKKLTSENRPEAKSIQVHVVNACAPKINGPITSDTQLIEEYIGGSLAEEYKRTYFGKEPIWSFGAETTATFSEADFLDRTAFLEVEDTKTEWEVSAYLGAVSPDGNTSFRLIGSYASTLDFPDDAEVCRPNMDGTQDCLNGPDGPPELVEDAFVSATVRHRFSKAGVVKNLAVAPIVTYNIDEKDWFFELPIYFQTNEDGGLDAGFRVGYNTRGDDFGAGVFVGVPF